MRRRIDSNGPLVAASLESTGSYAASSGPCNGSPLSMAHYSLWPWAGTLGSLLSLAARRAALAAIHMSLISQLSASLALGGPAWRRIFAVLVDSLHCSSSTSALVASLLSARDSALHPQFSALCSRSSAEADLDGFLRQTTRGRDPGD